MKSKSFSSTCKHYYTSAVPSAGISSERIASTLGTRKNLGVLCEAIYGTVSAEIIAEMNNKVEKAGETLENSYTIFEKKIDLDTPYLYSENEYIANCGDPDPDRYASFWFHPDHLGSSNYITDMSGNISQHMEYLPFGETLVEEHKNSNNSPYKFNGKELDDETGNYYYGARYYNPKFSIWLSVDPLAEEYPGWSPYNYTLLNPVRLVDPDGRSVDVMPPDEFDKNGNKISNLGEDKIDFYHQENGDTKIVDRASGASNIITGGESLIRGYTHRDKNTSWRTLFNEFDQGIGPEKSLLSDFDNSTEGIFGSMDGALSTYASKGRNAVLSSNNSSGLLTFDYSETNPLTAAFDGWEQFLGRTNLSYYKLGDKTLFLMHDSKSFESLSYRLGGSWNRSTFKLNGTTTQTYIWTESMNEVRQKAQIKQNWINRVRKTRQEYKAAESQRLPSIKY